MLECTPMEARVATQPAPWRLIAWLVFVARARSARRTRAGSPADDPPDDLAYRYSSSIAAIVQYGLMLGILLLIARGLPLREAFALRRPASWPRALGYAAVALVAIWLASAALSPLLDANDEQGFVPDTWDSSRFGAFAAFFVSVAVVAPIVEELTYRGSGVLPARPVRDDHRGRGDRSPLRRRARARRCAPDPRRLRPRRRLGAREDGERLPVDAPPRDLQRRRADRRCRRARLRRPAGPSPRRLPRAPRGSRRTPPASPSRGTSGTPPGRGRRGSRR